MLKKYKRQLARSISPVFPDFFDEELILSLLEKPKSKSHGHLSLPVFRLSKELKKPPAQVAQDLSNKIKNLNLLEISKVAPLSGFINFTWSPSFLNKVFTKFIAASTAAASATSTAAAASTVAASALSSPSSSSPSFSPSFSQKLGSSERFKGKRLIIDYSSPNIAKPMHVGHLRATVIGQAIRNLAETQGYEVIGLNHLGDWGVQYGKLAWAYERWGAEYDFETKAFESLYALYVRFHKEAEDNPEFEEEGAKTFKELEDGSEKFKRLWKKIIDISLKEYTKTWARLGVKHDLVKGESFYSDRLKAVVEELKEKNLLTLSKGAWVVELDGDRPPCLITKSDGASLYATRDLASALYRMEELSCDVNLYVVGQEQKLHFSQVFSVLERMGYKWAKECHHIAFGVYRFKDQGKMSSRKGQVISLSQVLDQAVSLVRKRMDERNPSLKNKDQISEIVGVGAVIFNDLLNDRVRDVEFDWDKLTDFEGNSGPYIQYSAVRCKSLIRKSGGESCIPRVELKEESELRLINSILDYESVLALSFDKFRPNYLATYLLDLAKTFSHFYSTCPILSLEDEALKQTRLYLVESCLKVFTSGLKVLNIQVPDEM